MLSSIFGFIMLMLLSIGFFAVNFSLVTEIMREIIENFKGDSEFQFDIVDVLIALGCLFLLCLLDYIFFGKIFVYMYQHSFKVGAFLLGIKEFLIYLWAVIA